MKKSILAAVVMCLLLTSCAVPGVREQKKSGNEVVAETSWKLTTDDSCMIFQNDTDWAWYQESDVRDDNYYAGTYKFYMGNDAVKHITEDLTEYGVTKDEIKQVISNNAEYSLEDFVCISVMNKSFLLEGEEQLKEDTPVSYFGFLMKDGTYLDIANMTNGNNFAFTKQ